MCLTIKNSKWTLGFFTPKPKVAEKDIVVSKMLLDYPWKKEKRLFQSPLYNYMWRVGTPALLVEFKFDKIALKGIDVKDGYHACVKRKNKKMYNMGFDHYAACYYLMIIPKGTRYYLGSKGDIVAETMTLANGVAYTAAGIQGEGLLTCV